MTRVEFKAAAKEQIKGKIGILFVCYLVIFGIGLVCGLIPVVGSVASMVITPAISLGLCLVFLGLTEGKNVEIATLFSRFSCVGKALWLSILIGVFTFLWSLLFWIPGIVKGLSYSMAYYVLAENPEMTAREALNESKAIMEGHKMDLFVLYLSFILWDILVACTFGIASVYVLPYQSATIANFYQGIKRQPQVTAEADMI